MAAPALRTIENESFEEIVVELENNKAFIRAYNPHGFYKISLQKGNLPEFLKGSYTSATRAEADLRDYLTLKGRDVKAA